MSASTGNENLADCSPTDKYEHAESILLYSRQRIIHQHNEDDDDDEARRISYVRL